MSTLVAQTISNGTVSTSSANVIQGSAKAWVNFNGVAQTIRASYNVTSITYNGTGDYTVNFTNAFADANYAPVYFARPTSADSLNFQRSQPAAPTTTAFRFTIFNAQNIAKNCEEIDVVFFR